MNGKLLERYSRNVLLNEIDIKGQVSAFESSVLFVGCGGLASFVLPTICAFGIGNVTIYDDDKVSPSNLPRQVIFTEKDIGKYKVDCTEKYLKARNKLCQINVHRKKYANEDISGYDCIVDLTDSYRSRISVNRESLKYKKPFFTGSAQRFTGHIYSFANHQANMPCYECLFPEIDESSCQTCEDAGVFPPVVEIVGGYISANIIKYITGINLDFTEFLSIDLLGNNKKIKLTKDTDCQCTKQT